jgi:hypothetical protein
MTLISCINKENSQSFHVGHKKSSEKKSGEKKSGEKKSGEKKQSYLKSYLKNVNRYLGKENKPASTKNYPECYKKTLANRFYYRRNTENSKKKPAEVNKKTGKTPYHEISTLIDSFQPVISSCKNLKKGNHTLRNNFDLFLFLNYLIFWLPCLHYI